MRRSLVILTICLASIGGSVLAHTLPEDSKCAWGPSYWCSGLPQAAKCGETAHCIQNVWNQNPYPQDDDEVCTICKQMVQQARDQLESNETQTEIKEVFEGSCDLIPIKIVANECKKLADEFVVELVETLASEMNPDTVCAVAGLCNSYRIDHMLKQYYASRAQVKTDCDVCREQTQKLSLKIRLMPEDDVLDRALQLCGRFSSYSDACRLTVLDNFNDILGALTHMDGFCDLSGICSESFNGIPTTLISSGDDLECEFCEKVVQHWIDQWKAKSTQEEFKEVLESICKSLGQPERIQRCLKIVDNYYIPLFNYILNELNPHTVCAAVDLCGSGEFFELENTPVAVVLPHSANDRIQSAIQDQPENSLVGGYFMPTAVQEMSKPGCAICEFVLFRLKEWMQDEHTQDEIEHGLEEICEALPSSVRNQCNQLVQVYGPAIAKLIIENVQPEQVCTLLQLCTPKALQVQAVESPIQEMQKKDEECSTCQFVMAVVVDGIRNKDNQDEIRNVLESVCTLLPSSMSGRCESFVASYAEQIIDMIANNLTPDEICQALSLCAAAKANNECSICKYVIQTLDGMLEDKTNVEQIEKALEEVCSAMPSMELKKKCKKLVEDYTELIVQLIADEATPDQVCDAIGLCSTPQIVKDAPKCKICEQIVQWMDGVIDDPNDVEKAKKYMEQMCSYLPKDSWKQECTSLVDTYTAKILDLIARGLTPEEVCQELGLCESMIEADSDEDDSSEEDSSEEDSSEEDSSEESERPYCLLCEYAIGELDSVVEDKHNQDEVRQALDQVCYRLSKPITKECLLMVNRYMDEIIDMFVKDYTPEKVCYALRMCKKQEVTPRPPVHENDIARFDANVQSHTMCTICEMGMSVLEKEILTNRTLDIIERSLLMMCAYLPESVAQKCEDFVNVYGDQVIELIIQSEMDPQEVCTELGVCDSPRIWDASVVGGRRCDFGPALWCQSKLHMMVCGTTDFCASRFASKFN